MNKDKMKDSTQKPEQPSYVPHDTLGLVNSGSPEAEFLDYSAKQTKILFDKLRAQTETIEQDIALGERKVLHKDEIAFLQRRHELAITKLQEAHAADLKKRKDTLAASLVARQDRKNAKREARKSIRASKKRDQIIQQQEKSAHAAARIRESISEKRHAFDALTQHMYNIHDKQRRNLIHAQERKSSNEKLMVDLETRHLKEEVRSTILKKFQVRQNHQGHLNKRINDNLREVQLLELRHAKEIFELEMVSFEEIGSKKILHENMIAELKLKQMNEMHSEKERALLLHESSKEEQIKMDHIREVTDLMNEQLLILKKLKQTQDAVMTTKKGSSLASSPTAQEGRSKTSSVAPSRDTQDEEGHKVERSEKRTQIVLTHGKQSIYEALQALALRHKQEMGALEAEIRQELDLCQTSFETKSAEMEIEHANAMSSMAENQDREIAELKAVQQKEIMMEESMHDSEMKMLVERRILNSVLETVADGIINITPIGTVVRFNHAAELMFGYEAKEVIGNNIIMLMPNRYGDNHHVYLNNYLTTGVKKVIGIGRRVAGLRKDGTEFPLHLSISELKEDGEHLFTGIARDLTEEVAEEERNKAIDAAKQQQLKNLVEELDVAKAKASDLLSQMLPKSVSKQLLDGNKVAPQAFDSATVFFMDVVGFDSITSSIHPLETVTLLNDLYRCVDKVIERYDVYKVETVGDTYMCVSGVPKPNKSHASETATMALHLLHQISKFEFTGHPDISIKVRIGINSGPLVAGVIGSKMPRYCLFGDTVNTASRMESNSEAMRIHISQSTYNLLQKDKLIICSERGEIEVKGKGKMKTYWVDSKKDFDPSVIA